jgi:hypothetical protein
MKISSGIMNYRDEEVIYLVRAQGTKQWLGVDLAIKGKKYYDKTTKNSAQD